MSRRAELAIATNWNPDNEATWEMPANKSPEDPAYLQKMIEIDMPIRWPIPADEAMRISWNLNSS